MYKNMQKNTQNNAKHEIGGSREQKWTEKHETFVKCVQLWMRKHDIPMDGIQQTV